MLMIVSGTFVIATAVTAWQIWRRIVNAGPHGSVSLQWIADQRVQDTKEGWIWGPRWKSPAERKADSRRERLARMAEARDRKRNLVA